VNLWLGRYLRFGRFVFLHEEKNERCRDEADCEQQSDEEMRSHGFYASFASRDSANSATHRLSAASLEVSGVGPRPIASRLPSKTLVSYAPLHNDSVSSHVRQMREVLISVPITEPSHRDVTKCLTKPRADWRGTV
jgi:hypothetical protein